MNTLVFHHLPIPIEEMKSAKPKTALMGSMIAEWELVHQFAAHSRADSLVFLVHKLSTDAHERIDRLPNRDRIRLLPLEHLSDLSRLRDAVVFSTDASISDCAYIRAMYGHPRWLVTGVTHALSSYFAPLLVLVACLSDMQPRDSFVCTSRAARLGARHLFDTIERLLTNREGRAVRCPIQLPCIPLPAPRFTAPLASRREARAALDLPPDAAVFLYFGRISEHMKADLGPLLFAFADVVDQVPNAMLVLAGDDHFGHAAPLEALARTLGIAEAVRVRRDPAADVKALLFSAADVFVSPSDSLQETFGLVLLEAMSAGLPVIASDWSGYRDIVRHEETGILVPTHWSDCVTSIGRLAILAGPVAEPSWTAGQSVAVDLPALTRAMTRLATDEEARHRMGARGASVAREMFDAEGMVRRYEDLWAASREMPAPAAIDTAAANALMAMDYNRLFGHYASNRISPDTRFNLTRRGEQLLAGGLAIPALDGDRAGFTRQRLLSLLGSFQASTHGSFGEIAGDATDERDLRHLMRLAKYGLLDVVPDEQLVSEDQRPVSSPRAHGAETRA